MLLREVGLVLSVNIEQWMLKIHNILSWQEVVGRIETNNLPDNVSFPSVSMRHR